MAHYTHPGIRTPRRGERGFTLIEIMVVVIIIGLLAAVIVPNMLGNVDKARVTKAKSDIQAMETGLTMFRLDNYIYPSNDMGLKALAQKPDSSTVKNWRPGGYLQHVNKDPWGNDYQYHVPGTHGGEYDLYSYGADGKLGGDPPYDADIGNWNLDQNSAGQ